ncbi:MAG: hypothetical protein ACI9X4_001761 [Glaciecola sp.]|jgi:hypothetical protein
MKWAPAQFAASCGPLHPLDSHKDCTNKWGQAIALAHDSRAMGARHGGLAGACAAACRVRESHPPWRSPGSSAVAWVGPSKVRGWQAVQSGGARWGGLGVIFGYPVEAVPISGFDEVLLRTPQGPDWCARAPYLGGGVHTATRDRRASFGTRSVLLCSPAQFSKWVLVQWSVGRKDT